MGEQLTRDHQNLFAMPVYTTKTYVYSQSCCASMLSSNSAGCSMRARLIPVLLVCTLSRQRLQLAMESLDLHLFPEMHDPQMHFSAAGRAEDALCHHAKRLCVSTLVTPNLFKPWFSCSCGPSYERGLPSMPALSLLVPPPLLLHAPAGPPGQTPCPI